MSNYGVVSNVRTIIPEQMNVVMNMFVKKGIEVFLTGEDLCNLILQKEQHQYNLYTTSECDDVKKFLKRYTDVNILP